MRSNSLCLGRCLVVVGLAATLQVEGRADFADSATATAQPVDTLRPVDDDPRLPLPYDSSSDVATSRFELPGIVEPVFIALLAVPSDGPLDRLAVTEGEQVAAGQLLASVDCRIAEQAVRAAALAAEQTGQQAAADNELRAARRYLERLLHAEQLKAASELEMDQARERMEQAEAAAIQAREQQAAAIAHWELERARLDAHRLTAPFAGKIVRLDAQKGQIVSRTVPIVTLADMTQLKVEIHVPVQWMAKLQVGEAYLLSAEEPVGKSIAARLVHSEPMIDAATQSFRTVFLIDNANEELPAGFAVRLAAPNPVAASTLLSHHP